MSIRINKLADVNIFKSALRLTESIMVKHLKEINRIVDFEISPDMELIDIYKLGLEKVQKAIGDNVIYVNNKHKLIIKITVDVQMDSDLLDLYYLYQHIDTARGQLYFDFTVAYIHIYNIGCWYEEGSEIYNAIEYSTNTDEELDELNEEELEYKLEMQRRFINSDNHKAIEKYIRQFDLDAFLSSLKSLSVNKYEVLAKQFLSVDRKFKDWDYAPEESYTSWQYTNLDYIFYLDRKDENEVVECNEIDSILSDIIGNMDDEQPVIYSSFKEWKNIDKKKKYALEQWNLRKQIREAIYDLHHFNTIRETFKA